MLLLEVEDLLFLVALGGEAWCCCSGKQAEAQLDVVQSEAERLPDIGHVGKLGSKRGGQLLGNVLPLRAVSALSVGLYGMFLAIIIPPARKSRVVAGLVAAGFLTSFLASRLPLLAEVSSGVKTIVLTAALALGAAVLFPVKEADAHDR